MSEPFQRQAMASEGNPEASQGFLECLGDVPPVSEVSQSVADTSQAVLEGLYTRKAYACSVFRVHGTIQSYACTVFHVRRTLWSYACSVFHVRRTLQSYACSAFRVCGTLQSYACSVFCVRRALWSYACSVFRVRKTLWSYACSVFRARRTLWSYACSVFRVRQMLWSYACSVFRARRTLWSYACSVLGLPRRRPFWRRALPVRTAADGRRPLTVVQYILFNTLNPISVSLGSGFSTQTPSTRLEAQGLGGFRLIISAETLNVYALRSRVSQYP